MLFIILSVILVALNAYWLASANEYFECSGINKRIVDIYKNDQKRMVINKLNLPMTAGYLMGSSCILFWMGVYYQLI